MIHHSISHGAVSLLSLIGAQMLSNKIEGYFPTLYYWNAHFAKWLISSFHLGVEQQDLQNACVVLVLGLVWGIGFWHLSARNAWR